MMIPFVILLVAPICVQHIVFGNKEINFEKKNKAALAFFFVWLTVLVMLRHESIGNDTRNYIYFFNNFCEMDWVETGKKTIEFGFSYLNKVVSVFSKNPQALLGVAAVLTTVMIYPTYKRLCLDPSLTIVLFCTMSTFVMLFSGIRQMLAIGIGFIAYEFVRRKKLLPFLICVLVAVTFHTSAFMLFFMYPVYRVKITKKWLLVVVPVLATVFIFNKQIFTLLNVIINRFTRFDGEITSTGAFTMLLLLVIFVIFVFLIPDENLLDEETIGMRNFLLLSLTLQMFAPLHMLAMRMNYYYIIFIPLLLPKIINCRSKRWEQVAVVGRHLMVVFFFIYFFWNASTGGNLNVFPYHFFWEAV